MRATQELAGLLVTTLQAQLPAQLASVRSRYGLTVDTNTTPGQLADISVDPDTGRPNVFAAPHPRLEPDQLPAVEIEVLGKRPEPRGAVSYEIGATIQLDRRATARIWVHLRGQEYDDMLDRQSYTALAVEEVLLASPALPADTTVRVDPTSVAYDLSDVGVDPNSGRSLGAVRFQLDLIFSEEITPWATVPNGGSVGTADTVTTTVTELAPHPALA